MKGLLLTMTMSAGLALAACASQAPPTSVSPGQGASWVQKGYVTDVRDVTENRGENSAIGSVLGALAGSIAGNSIGAGTGRTVATIGGAAAGGVAGQAAGRAGSVKTSTKLTVRSENGEINTYYAEPGEAFRIGDEVRIVSDNGNIKVTH